MTKPNLRQEMPLVTAFIDCVREVFGAEEINASIKAGIAGQQTFYARENGRETGTPCPDQGIHLSEMQINEPDAPTQATRGKK